MYPSEYRADWGLSVKVFMPLAKDKFLLLFCQVLSGGNFPGFQARRLPQEDLVTDNEDGLATSFLHMDMQWLMVIAVEVETKAVFGENLRHEFKD